MLGLFVTWVAGEERGVRLGNMLTRSLRLGKEVGR